MRRPHRQDEYDGRGHRRQTLKGNHRVKERRKRMRKAIREAMSDPRPWLEVVEGLQAKGIPLNLILAEANAYGIERKSR